MICIPCFNNLALREQTKKHHPSPSVNPDSHWGFVNPDKSVPWQGTGLVLGKADFNLADNPLFIEALILTIFCKPSEVRCSFRFIISKARFKSSKSARFWVNSGYLSKWVTVADRSSTELTLYWISFFPDFAILPTP